MSRGSGSGGGGGSSGMSSVDIHRGMSSVNIHIIYNLSYF